MKNTAGFSQGLTCLISIQMDIATDAGISTHTHTHTNVRVHEAFLEYLYIFFLMLMLYRTMN
jgi:hypothetical protein